MCSVWTWKTPWNHTSLWKQEIYALLAIREVEMGLESEAGCRGRDGPLRGREGLFHEAQRLG